MTMVEPSVSSDSSPEWVRLVDGAAAGRSERRPPSVGQVVGRFVLANLIGGMLLLAGGVGPSQQAARAEPLADARHATDMLAALLVEPNLDSRLADGDREAAAALNVVLQPRLAAAGVLRVKIWTPEGRIVYSDEPRLIERTYPLSDDDLQALRDGITRAELSDLRRPENRFERSAGRLLEVYRQIMTPDGRPMLLETYSSYSDATARQVDIWIKFAPITVSVLLALLAMQLPLAHRMVAQLRASQQERELLQARALDTSTEERRRIAGASTTGSSRTSPRPHCWSRGPRTSSGRDRRTDYTGRSRRSSATPRRCFGTPWGPYGPCSSRSTRPTWNGRGCARPWQTWPPGCGPGGSTSACTCRTVWTCLWTRRPSCSAPLRRPCRTS